jgi:peptidoglycan/xylan/chitin deacetylase (PgdA/CDA1 family)
MKHSFLGFLCILLVSQFITPVCAKELPMKIAIIKADDVKNVNANWTKFFDISRDKGIKVSAGIICNSLQGDNPLYAEWLNHWQNSGLVEFWNHGWDHKRWGNDKKKQTKEFSGSGYDHQKKHFEDAQSAMERVLGKAPVAFGAPYNAMDSNTARVLKENKDLLAVFCYPNRQIGGKIPMPMVLKGEGDGTGKPNFEKFKAAYDAKPGVNMTAIQFHPGNFGKKQFDEYIKIIDFLKAEDWTFMLPSEYVSHLSDTEGS